jgi:hypothetical protein
MRSSESVERLVTTQPAWCLGVIIEDGVDGSALGLGVLEALEDQRDGTVAILGWET